MSTDPAVTAAAEALWVTEHFPVDENDMRLPSRDLKGGTAWKRRADDQTVASYLQRYCTKNDTIGFFGPVGWARLGSTGPTVAVEPGPALVEHRATRIEQWAVDER